MADSIIPQATAAYAVSIPTGQWSGSGSDRYITVNANNVTADSILIPQYDHASEALLKGPVWCVPAAGSFTIHTTDVPTGTVSLVVLMSGIVGEAQYQVLADVYSKAQTDALVAQSKASSYEKWTAQGVTSGNIYLARSGKTRILSFEDVVVPTGASFVVTAIPDADCPAFLTVGSLFAGSGACASIWVRASGTFGSSGAIGHTLNGVVVWFAK